VPNITKNIFINFFSILNRKIHTVGKNSQSNNGLFNPVCWAK